MCEDATTQSPTQEEFRLLTVFGFWYHLKHKCFSACTPVRDYACTPVCGLCLYPCMQPCLHPCAQPVTVQKENVSRELPAVHSPHTTLSSFVQIFACVFAVGSNTKGGTSSKSVDLLITTPPSTASLGFCPFLELPVSSVYLSTPHAPPQHVLKTTPFSCCVCSVPALRILFHQENCRPDSDF